MQKVIKMNGCVDHIIVIKEVDGRFDIDASSMSGPHFRIFEPHITTKNLSAMANDVECRVKCHMEMEVENRRGKGFVVLNNMGYH